jgi:hypothetical protein
MTVDSFITAICGIDVSVVAGLHQPRTDVSGILFLGATRFPNSARSVKDV